MKLKDIVIEMQIFDVDKADEQTRSQIQLDKFYVFVQTLKKDMVIGPFETHDEAEKYMREKISEHVRRKTIIGGEEVVKIL